MWQSVPMWCLQGFLKTSHVIWFRLQTALTVKTSWNICDSKGEEQLNIECFKNSSLSQLLPTKGESKSQTQQIPKLHPSGFRGAGTDSGLVFTFSITKAFLFSNIWTRIYHIPETNLRKSLSDSSVKLCFRRYFWCCHATEQNNDLKWSLLKVI